MQFFEQELAKILGIFQQKRQAAPALKESLGGLPPQRAQLLERLSKPVDFPVAGTGISDLK